MMRHIKIYQKTGKTRKTITYKLLSRRYVTPVERTNVMTSLQLWDNFNTMLHVHLKVLCGPADLYTLI